MSVFKILVTYDFSGIPVKNFGVESASSLPTSGNFVGRLFVNSSDGSLSFYNGTSFKKLATADAVIGDHQHDIADVTGLQAALDGKAALNHVHAIDDVTGLQAALDSKSDLGHGHSNATTSAPGFMSVSDKTKLDGIATGAQVNTVTGVFGRTGNISAQAGDYSAIKITFTPTGNISATTVQAAIAELDTEKAALVHGHVISDVTGLQTALDSKSALGHQHPSSDITDFSSAVDNRIISYFDTTAGSDAQVDTLRELLDMVLNNADSLTNIVKRVSGTIGDGTSQDIAITHNLATKDILFQLYDAATDEAVGVSWTLDSTNSLIVHFAQAPALNAYRYVIMA